MHLKTIVAALRAGQEIPHATGVKWAGLAVTGVSLALSAIGGLALARGWIQTAWPMEQVYELAGLIVTTVLAFLGLVQVATTPRIGLLPPAKPPAPPPDEHIPESEAGHAPPSGKSPPGPFGF
jgi:hypothetical protein